jgi:hypothetical protein
LSTAAIGRVFATAFADDFGRDLDFAAGWDFFAFVDLTGMGED